MNLDRLETLAAINFIKDAIPDKAETGKNCLFIRVDEGKLVLTGGGEFVTKKAILIRPNTIDEASGIKKKLPKTFMIPRADLLAFAEMMKQHKADCKKMAKNDPSYMFIDITDKELISHDGKVVYEQPKFEFKDLEYQFQISKATVSETKIDAADMSTVMSGFKKSKPVEVTFTGFESPIHFAQGDYEAILLPPKEKGDDDNRNDQTSFGEGDED